MSSDVPFLAVLGSLSVLYGGIIAAMLLAEASYTSAESLLGLLRSPEMRFSMLLSLLSSLTSTLLALWVGVPVGYLLARFAFPGKTLLDALFDVPIVLPPLVLGLCLLILFQTPAGQGVQQLLERVTEPLLGYPLGVTYQIPSVILAQFMVASAFAIRTMRVTFDQIDPRCEQVALTLGCNRAEAFFRVSLPQARRGMLTAATLAWARSLGEFGPVLIFAGATPLKTEVLPTTVYLQMSAGNLEAAVAASLVLVAGAMLVLVVARLTGLKTLGI